MATTMKVFDRPGGAALRVQVETRRAAVVGHQQVSSHQRHLRQGRLRRQAAKPVV